MNTASTDSYIKLTLHFPLTWVASEKSALDQALMQDFNCDGVEDLSLSEDELNVLLGSSAVTGGPLPSSVLDSLEDYALSQTNKKSTYYFYGAQSLDRAMKAQHFIKTQFPLIEKMSVDQCKEENWIDQWKQYYKPIEISEDLIVLPSWVSGDGFTHKHQLSIDPGQAFGTGSHESTRLCLQLLSSFFTTNQSNEAFSVIDFGCGSGILAIATLLLNNNVHAHCFDIDPEAYSNIKTNCTLNHISIENVTLIPASNELSPPWSTKSYDLVMANILLPILLDKAQLLSSLVAPKGYFLLSGIMTDQWEELSTALLQYGQWEIIGESELNSWKAVLLQKLS